MLDPTYNTEMINLNPAWKLAFLMSEIENGNAPLGWGHYIYLAEMLVSKGYGEIKNET